MPFKLITAKGLGNSGCEGRRVSRCRTPEIATGWWGLCSREGTFPTINLKASRWKREGVRRRTRSTKLNHTVSVQSVQWVPAPHMVSVLLVWHVNNWHVKVIKRKKLFSSQMCSWIHEELPKWGVMKPCSFWCLKCVSHRPWDCFISSGCSSTWI